MKRNKPRVALIVPGLGVVKRGIEIFTQELIKRLQDEFHFTVFSRGPVARGICQHTLRALPRNNYVTTAIYNSNSVLAKALNGCFLDPLNLEMLTASILALPSLLKRNFDLVFPLSSVWGAITARLVRVVRQTPFVVCGYTGSARQEYWMAKQKPDTYIALTQVAQRNIRTAIPGVHSIVVPNGVDLDKFSPYVKAKLKGLERPAFLCVAALVPIKRVDVAIQAVARLQAGSLVVLGEGPLRNALARMGHQLLGRERFFLTSLPHSLMPAYYTSCDVFTLPSRDESFGIAQIEALACNRPVVAPRDEVREEIVGDAGILCDNVENIDAYAECLAISAKTDFGDRPRKRAERFDWEHVSRYYADLFHRLIGW